MRKRADGRRACDVGGCWQAWPCELHGARQAAGGQFETVEGAKVVALGACKCPLGSNLGAGMERSCKCGYHVCSGRGACAPRHEPRPYEGGLDDVPEPSSVLQTIHRKAEELYCRGDRLVEVSLPRRMYYSLLKNPGRHVYYSLREPEGVTADTCWGPVKVTTSSLELRWVTELDASFGFLHGRRMLLSGHDGTSEGEA